MDGSDGVDVGLHYGCDTLVNFPSIGMSTNSMPDRVLGMAPSNPLFGSGWDPFFSLNQIEHFQGSSMVSSNQYGHPQQHLFLESQGTCASSAYGLPHDPSVPAFFEDPRIFSATIGAFAVPEVENPGCHPNYSSNGGIDGNGEILPTTVVSYSEEEAAKSSQKERRRKRGADKNEKELKGDPSKDSGDALSKKDEKKQKLVVNPCVNSGSKQGGDDKALEISKPNYIHVRARRGQATNSHSLAERVRREKISERMRTLQELVPGCSKITGKAVMLDEIINYVQSLQQQVEFLSMKLATVNPEISVDLERVLSKYFSDLRGGTATTPGVGFCQPFPPGKFHEVLPTDHQNPDPQHLFLPLVE